METGHFEQEIPASATAHAAPVCPPVTIGNEKHQAEEQIRTDDVPQKVSEAAPARAVRLSYSFRLPAAVMARSMVAGVREISISPQVEAASEEVVNHFYREIAREAAGSSEEDTVVVEPDVRTEPVLRSADQLYRTLFGDEAYNRQAMRSAIDVTLPVPPEAGNWR